MTSPELCLVEKSRVNEGGQQGCLWAPTTLTYKQQLALIPSSQAQLRGQLTTQHLPATYSLKTPNPSTSVDSMQQPSLLGVEHVLRTP